MLANPQTYDVSVIIPTYNRSKLLSLTINSLVNQGIEKDKFEVIVCDDGSSDDTAQMLENYRDQLNIKYVFQEDKGYRPASARNRGIRLSEAKICLFIDSSVILDPDCLAEHISYYANKGLEHAAIGYVYGFDHDEMSDELLRRLIDSDNIPDSIHRLQLNETYLDAREISYNKYHDNISNLPAPWFYFWTCHLSVGTEQLKKAGLFDENYDGRWGVEDNDLGFRLHQNSIKISLLRKAKSIHYPHDKNKLERIAEGLDNRKYFHQKFGSNETKLFLECFKPGSTEYIDINDTLLNSCIYNSSI